MIYIDPSTHPYFQQLARVIQYHLKERSEITTDYTKKGTWILNYVSFKNGVEVNGPYIAVQTEQMNIKGTAEYQKWLNGAVKVWDWTDNMFFGYSPFYRLQADEAKDIDVLFYGTLNARRLQTLQNLSRKNPLTIVVNEYGDNIWRRIHRSKVVLSVHYYEKPENDLPRIAPLLSNRVFVIAEETVDPKFNALKDHIVIVPKDKIPETVDYFLERPFERFEWQDKGYDWIRQHPHING